MTRAAWSGTLRSMEQRATPTPLFSSILCGTDNGPAGVAARRQAEWLSDGTVDLVPTRELTAHGPAALAEHVTGHDLIVLGSEPAAHVLLPHVAIPALLVRWCPDGYDVTDRILVAVGDHAGAARVATLAAEIARRHGGEVSLVAAPGRSHDLDRALAATGRILVTALGASPHVLGELAPPEVAVPAVAARCRASLLIAGVGDDAWDAAYVSELARRTGCSTLAVPAPTKVGRRFVRSIPQGELMPA